MGSLFGEIVRSFEIPAKKADLSVCILLKQYVSVRSRELTMNADRRRAGNGCYLPSPFAARLKASNGAVENNEIADTRGVAVAVAKDMLKLSVLLYLANEVLVEGNLEFGRQLDFVRLD